MKLFLYLALLLAINANEDKYEPRWDFSTFNCWAIRKRPIRCSDLRKIVFSEEHGRDSLRALWEKQNQARRRVFILFGSDYMAWQPIQGLKAFRSWHSGLLIGREHFENPSYRESIQKAEMTSLAETVSSAIIERHPEIGTLKKINEVKEYIDDGAISKGKVVHGGFEDAQSFQHVVDRTVRHSTLSPWILGNRKNWPWKTLRKNGWLKLECHIRFYLKPRWKMKQSFHAEQWLL